MAEQEKTAKPSAPTERVVLLAVNLQTPQLKELVPESQHKLLAAVPEEGVVVWLEVGAGQGGKAKAVDNIAGAVDDLPQIEGKFRAPSKRSWEGGIELTEEVVPEARKAVRRHFS